MAEGKNVPEKMNFYQKLQACRVDLQKRNLKKTGLNKYSNYTYYDLGDILPAINEITNQYKLVSIFKFDMETATLTIKDTESGEEEVWSTPVIIPELKGAYAIQNIGAAQSYSHRYLLFMAYEIAEGGDMLDNPTETGHDEELIQKQHKINAVKVGTVNAMLEKTGADVPVFLKYYKLKKVEDITNEQFPIIMNTLQKKLDDSGKAAAPEIGKLPDLGM